MLVSGGAGWQYVVCMCGVACAHIAALRGRAAVLQILAPAWRAPTLQWLGDQVVRPGYYGLVPWANGVAEWMVFLNSEVIGGPFGLREAGIVLCRRPPVAAADCTSL